MDLFDFPMHQVETQNPDSSVRGQFGNSYMFVAPPSAPDQRVFVLTFAGMKFYTDDDGTVDATINPQLNMKALIDFYTAHKTYSPFHYIHPVYGELEVRFSKPLQEPKSLLGAGGVTAGFTVELIEVP